ncbi:hypothetical protein FBZ33_3695 [Micromonospora sp. A202]|nr:hypothetical protein FBZ33_3695 [Micromonospora sp. A202]
MGGAVFHTPAVVVGPLTSAVDLMVRAAVSS